jgi:hypothetical protein
LLPVLIFLLLAVPSAIAFKSGVSGLTEGLTRVEVPGETTLDFEPGTYTVFYEYVTVMAGRVVRRARAISDSGRPLASDSPQMQISVTPTDGGTAPDVRPTAPNLTYSVPSHAGYSIAEFTVINPGSYVFAVSSTERLGGKWVLALGKDKVKSTVRTVLGVVVFFGGGFVAIIIATIIFIVRFRNRRSLERAGFPA